MTEDLTGGQDFSWKPKDAEDRAYGEGMQACEEGKSLDDNPHRADTEMADQWETGWHDMDADLGDGDDE